MKLTTINSIVAAALCAVGFSAWAEDPAGSEGNPWQIGATKADNVVAWTNGTGKLVIEGAGAIKDFTNTGREDKFTPWHDFAGSILEVEIPSGVTRIGNYTFASNAIESVTIPSGVTSIGDSAFYSCQKLTDVEIPSSVTKIGLSAFNTCKALTSITIPASVESIGGSVFRYCKKLTSVTVLAVNPPTLGAKTFDNNDKALEAIYVPKDSVDAYKEAANWSTYKDFVKELVVPPTAKVEKFDAEGYEVAAKFTAQEIGVSYDDWAAKFVLVSDTNIGEGEIKLGGSYKEWESGKWVDIDFPGCTAGEEIDVLGLANIGKIKVTEVFNVIKEFTCGVKNVGLKNDATFTLKLVITDGETTKEVRKIDSLTVKEQQPEAKVEELDPAPEGLDAAAVFTVAAAGGNSYRGWKADFFLVPSTDIPANTIALSGQFDAHQKEWVTLPVTEELEADEHYPIMRSLLGEPTTWGNVVDAVKTFKCGLVNKGFTEKFDVRIEFILTNEDGAGETLTLEAFEAEIPEAVKPEARVEATTVEGLDSAATFTAAGEYAWRYANWKADFLFSADKDIPAGAITFKGDVEGKLMPIELGEDYAKGTKVSVLGLSKEIGGYRPTYDNLYNLLKKFTCGLVNNSFAEGFNVSIELVLMNPDDETDTLSLATFDDEISECGVKVGENAYARISGGELTIHGTGSATNFPAGFPISSVTNVVVQDGITSIGKQFFRKCTNMESATFGKDVASFGEKAFQQCYALETINVANKDALVSLMGAVTYRLMYDDNGNFVMAPKVNVEGYVEMLYGKEKLTDADWALIGKLSDQNLEDLKKANFYHFFQTRLDPK